MLPLSRRVTSRPMARRVLELKSGMLVRRASPSVPAAEPCEWSGQCCDSAATSRHGAVPVTAKGPGSTSLPIGTPTPLTSAAGSTARGGKGPVKQRKRGQQARPKMGLHSACQLDAEGFNRALGKEKSYASRRGSTGGWGEERQAPSPDPGRGVHHPRPANMYVGFWAGEIWPRLSLRHEPSLLSGPQPKQTTSPHQRHRDHDHLHQGHPLPRRRGQALAENPAGPPGGYHPGAHPYRAGPASQSASYRNP